MFNVQHQSGFCGNYLFWQVQLLCKQCPLNFHFYLFTGILDNSSMKLDLMYCAFSFSFSLTASSSSLTFLIVEFSNAFSSFRWLLHFLMSLSSAFCSYNFSDMSFRRVYMHCSRALYFKILYPRQSVFL